MLFFDKLFGTTVLVCPKLLLKSNGSRKIKRNNLRNFKIASFKENAKLFIIHTLDSLYIKQTLY